MTQPTYDLILFGATSFVGKILTEYLFEHFGEQNELKWAIAGRSQKKLDELQKEESKIPTLVVDALDEEALEKMCKQTRVVLSTVGPYAFYGEPLVKVCAKTGTDYCDLTGEVPWIKRMIESYEDEAKNSGARIVHCCGFDSIPSDLGVYFLQQKVMEKWNTPCSQIKMRIKAIRGGLSGGTVASLINVIREMKNEPALKRKLQNPYFLCSRSFSTRQPEIKGSAYDSDYQSWITPFLMAPINTRIVHRSNELFQNTYGENFLYDEAILTGKKIKGRMSAFTATAGLVGLMATLSISPLRWALEKSFLPAPGEGPELEKRLKGFYKLSFLGKTEKGKTLEAIVTGDQDPGYGSTAKMFGQAGVCLALDIKKEQKIGGFWTPATVFEKTLIDRLRQHSGMTFELKEE